jgi:hypothetical protein
MATAKNSGVVRHLLLVVIAATACRDANSTRVPETGSATAAGGSGSGSGSGSAAFVATNPNDYVPAEFKSGASRWKDTGVYVDGKPIGFIQFGELPIALKPTWVKDKVSTDKPADCPIEKCPGWKWSQQRYYKFTDYLKAVGVDPRTVKMLHVYGPKMSQTIAVTGRDLMSPAANEFMFHFGADVAGKPIPHVPENFGNGKSPDKMQSLMIYIAKKPPIVTKEGIELDGVEQLGVPYYGEPIRGGVRIYLDDKLATIIKRQELDVKKATKTPDGELHWSFGELLTASGVDTSKIVEGWVIQNERRTAKIAWSDLEKMTFSAGSKAHGGVMLGPKETLANAIALHTRPIAPDELPKILPEEEN